MLRGADAMNYNWQWHRVPQYLYTIEDGEIIWGPLIDGLMVTLEIGVYSIVLGLLIGLITAFLRLSGSFSGKILATIYLEAIRNTPLLVQLFVFYFVFGPIFELDRFWVAVLCIAFFEGSFASEVIRGGIMSVPKGQWEASDAVGLTRAQAINVYHSAASDSDHVAAIGWHHCQLDQTLRHCECDRGIRSDNIRAGYYFGDLYGFRNLDCGGLHIPSHHDNFVGVCWHAGAAHASAWPCLICQCTTEFHNHEEKGKCVQSKLCFPAPLSPWA